MRQIQHLGHFEHRLSLITIDLNRIVASYEFRIRVRVRARANYNKPDMSVSSYVMCIIPSHNLFLNHERHSWFAVFSRTCQHPTTFFGS